MAPKMSGFVTLCLFLHTDQFCCQSLLRVLSESNLNESDSNRSTLQILPAQTLKMGQTLSSTDKTRTESTNSAQQMSPRFDRTNQTFQVPCRTWNTIFSFPDDRESHLRIYYNGQYKGKKQGDSIQCCGWLRLARSRKFISLKIQPFQPAASCKKIHARLKIGDKIFVYACDKPALFHSLRNQVKIDINLKMHSLPFSVTIAVRAFNENGEKFLKVAKSTEFAGTVTPYGFDGFTDLAKQMAAVGVLKPPRGHSLMLSFPHFHTGALPGCASSVLALRVRNPWGELLWRRCGNLQLPPEVLVYYPTFWFRLYTNTEIGYSGFKVRFSYHSAAEIPGKLVTTDATSTTFNCSVPFYTTFSQHLECNLETECLHAEDEVNCPYLQGSCEPHLLNAGGKCYKYVRTRRIMTWYDASSVCLKQGMTLASFPTYKQGKAFRDDILRYAPTTFNTFIGLRTSDSSLPSMYREVWQWSSGIMAFYVNIEDQQLFKPTCASFAALDREEISTTMCGYYEYMHYIFCEQNTHSVLNESSQINLQPTEVSSEFRLVESTRFATCLEGHVTHVFLSCDHASRCGAERGAKSCVAYSSIRSGTADRSVQVPMFLCDSQTQAIHYTQVCDHQAQCLDSSDESFCIHPACSEKQCLNQQCVTDAEWCDGMLHCSDGSDEACPQYVTGSARPPSTSTAGFHVVLFDGRGRYKYIPQGKEFPACPQNHFMCANRGLCLPVYLRCNDVYDCADREDEINCEDVTCPDFYLCRGSAVCVHSDHLCDGVFQCPQQDDELLCQLVCPDNCLCQGLAFICPQRFPTQFYSELRYLDSSGSGLKPDQLVHNHSLIRLSLARCGLHTLPVLEFPNLKFLYLDNNVLTNINMHVFLKLSNLNFLSLSRNPIVNLVASESNVLLKKIHSLDLSFTKLRVFQSMMLRNIRQLKNLNMSHGVLKVIGYTGFESLTHLESLDLRGSKLKEYPVKMLQPLTSLRAMFTDVYKLCCKDILPEKFNTQNCFTSPDEIASCEDLLRSDIYRMFLWISCCFALVGNAGSFAAKFYMQKLKKKTGFNVFIAHLNVADFLMGLYLVVVGSADQVYRGAYMWHDEEWKRSRGCRTAGFCSLLSCEMSAMVICFITLDRFLVVRFPFSQLHFRNTSAHVVCGLSWTTSIVLAAIPLLPMTSQWEFYSQTDICIPLPVTKQNFRGHLYSFGILIVFNFVLFVLTAVGQLFIYLSISANAMDSTHKHTRELAVAKRLLTVVMSDFLCWFPIGLCGLLAFNGVSIPGEVNVAMAIFALPLNSALNPFLYTYNLLSEKRQQATEARLMKILETRYAAKARTGELS